MNADFIGPRDVNPRYLAYMRAHGETNPEAMLDRGTTMAFMRWINERWSEWHRARCTVPRCESRFDHPIREAEHADFDAWLAGRNQ